MQQREEKHLYLISKGLHQEQFYSYALSFLLAIPFQKAENSIYFPTDLCLPIDFSHPPLLFSLEK